MFEVIPAIDVSNGRAVRLVEGSRDDVTEYGDPVEFAVRWIDAGARRIHVVDIDGAFAGSAQNRDAITAVSGVAGSALQVAGGIRTLDAIGYWAAREARVVLGTQAIVDRRFLEAALTLADVCVALDAREGVLRLSGWTESSGLDLIETGVELSRIGVKRFLSTDIARDGRFTGPNVVQLSKLADATGVPVIASGGVSSVDDLEQLAATPGIEGAVVGKALYDGRIKIEEALACSRSA